MEEIRLYTITAVRKKTPLVHKQPNVPIRIAGKVNVLVIWLVVVEIQIPY